MLTIEKKVNEKKVKNSEMVAKVETAIIELEKVYAYLGYDLEKEAVDDTSGLKGLRQHLHGLLYELADDSLMTQKCVKHIAKTSNSKANNGVDNER